MERQRLGLRFLEADPGLALREGPGSGEGGREDGHSQEGAQHGGEEVVDVPEGLEGRKCVRGQKRHYNAGSAIEINSKSKLQILR